MFEKFINKYNLPEEFILRLISSGWSIIIVIIGAIVLNLVIKFSVTRAIDKFMKASPGNGAHEVKERIKTLQSVCLGTLQVVIWLVAVIIILSELGVDIGPILAVAGVLGVAVGFGGQYLIRDVFSGFFILLEDQYHVGDFVKIKHVSGTVESINLRLTVLRDLSGVVHHIPNGEIDIASNETKHFSRINMDVLIEYQADTEEVIALINKVGQELANDETWKKDITEAPQFMRINQFVEWGQEMKIIAKTRPGRHWAVSGELRKRLKVVFDDNGIYQPRPNWIQRNEATDGEDKKIGVADSGKSGDSQAD